MWRRVAEYDARYGSNGTSSYAEHADRADRDVRRLIDGLRPLPGQAGVVVGIAGEPVLAEVFDSPSTLASQFRSIVEAAGMDAIGQEERATPSRLARRFVDRAGRVRRRPGAPAGLGTTLTGADPVAAVSALAWRGRDVHVVATNPRHRLNLVRGH